MLSEIHLQVCHVCPYVGSQSCRVFWAYKDIILTLRKIYFVAGCRSQTVPHHVKNWSQENQKVSPVSAENKKNRNGKWDLSLMPTSIH